MVTYPAAIFLDLAIICTIIPHNYPEPIVLALNFELLFALSFEPCALSFQLYTLGLQLSALIFELLFALRLAPNVLSKIPRPFAGRLLHMSQQP